MPRVLYWVVRAGSSTKHVAAIILGAFSYFMLASDCMNLIPLHSFLTL